MIRQISVTYIHSAHGEKLAEWYAKTLGLKVFGTWPNWTQFELEDGPKLAVSHTSFPQSVVERQPIVFSLEVDDIHQAVTDLAARGVKFHPSAKDTVFDVGPQLVATFQDPDGNWVQVN